MYVKIFREILMSSIWDEDTDVRLLWITLLVLADQDGYVRGTPEALARAARLSRKAVDRGLEVLQMPDPESRTSENDGRRIEPAPGGFMVLNYKAYRETRNEEERRAYMRDYMRTYRKRKVYVNTPLTGLAQAEEDTDTSEEVQHPPTPQTGGGGGGLSIMDQLENDVDEAAKKAKCPDAMLNKLAEKANQVYGTDYPVAEFLEVFVYPADSILSAADLLEAIRQTGLAGVKRANWTNAVLRAWHEGGGRPDAVVMQGGKPKIDMKAVFEKFKKDHPEYANDLE